MKTSKTTLQKSNVDSQKKVKKMEKDTPSNLKAIILGGIGIILVIALIVGMALENFRPKLIMTIDNEKVTMNNAMYYLYTAEAQGNYMDSLYSQIYGQSYWDMTDDSGATYRDTAKTQSQQAIQMYTILYKEAVKAGYKINSDDKKSAAKDVKQIRKNLTFEQKNKQGLTKGALTKALERKYCADRYRQDIIDGFDIDDQKIRDGVKKADFRQYDVQYYSIDTKTTDKDGNQVDISKDKLAEYKAELEELAKRAATEDFDSLTPNAVEVTKEANSSSSDETEASAEPSEDKDEKTYTSQFTANGKFVVGDGTFTTGVENKLKKMKNDEVSGVIVGDGKLYLAKMINNNDDEAYETEVKNQITTKENEEFDTWYQKVAEKYSIKLNTKVWDSIVIGNVLES